MRKHPFFFLAIQIRNNNIIQLYYTFGIVKNIQDFYTVCKHIGIFRLNK